MRTKALALIAILLGAAAAAPACAGPAAKHSALEGAWTVIEVRPPGAAPETHPQPSLYIFTGNHYAILRVTSRQPRVALDLKSATAEQLLAVYSDDGFIANAGTYETKAGTLTTHSSVAKNPGRMKPGAFVAFRYRIDHGTLTLTETGYDDEGAIPAGVTRRLKRLE
ncbi:MAG: hypothetical protein JWP49_1163 [Phenylobacterium sp.]|nr:hypothetical protein [Phenylobacterium sp.]